MYAMQPSMYASMSASTAGNETTVVSPGVSACVRIWVYWLWGKAKEFKI